MEPIIELEGLSIRFGSVQALKDLRGSFGARPLLGITQDSVVRIAGDLSIPVRRQAVPREMLYTADELFFTGTASEVTPIRSVDRIPIGPGRAGPITRQVQERYLALACGEMEDVHDWLTPVRAEA